MATSAEPELTSAQLLYKEREKAMTDKAIENLAPLPIEPVVSPIYKAKVEDFAGKVDGAGVKQVMTEPKTPIELIPPQFIEQVAAVLLHGKKKYAANNWMRGMSWTTVLGGVFRHCFAFARGEHLDPESGLPHLAHAACGIMFLLWYTEGPQKEQHGFTDDRVFLQ